MNNQYQRITDEITQIRSQIQWIRANQTTFDQYGDENLTRTGKKNVARLMGELKALENSADVAGRLL